MKRCIAFAVCCLLLAGCAGLSRQGRLIAGIRGMVYDMDGLGVKGATVKLGGFPPVSTDATGRFIVESGIPGGYRLRVEKAGYEEYEGAVDVPDDTFVIYVKVSSAAQIRASAERRMAEREWAAAGRDLDRANALDPDDSLAAFLEGIVALRGPVDAERATDAEARLLKASAAGLQSAELWLLLADIGERYGRDGETIRGRLENAYRLAPRPEIGKRLEEMSPEAE